MTGTLHTVEARPLVDYYPRLSTLAAGPEPAGGWEPIPLPPTLSPDLRHFLARARMRWLEAPSDAPCRAVLDLRSDPDTQTTKTFPSLLIVARAIHHIRTTGERITILTPSSANKATALRSAVLTAVERGLVDARSLSVVSVLPTTSTEKLRRTALSSRPELRILNPLLQAATGPPDAVKALVTEAAGLLGAPGAELPAGERLWLTLKLDNYTVADAARALFEANTSPATDNRLHAHAVSSAYGLLGYERGREMLRRQNGPGSTARPGFLLVQHLRTSDMVQHLQGTGTPPYRYDAPSQLFRQDADPHWPAEVSNPDEDLEPTFYTRRPATSGAMTGLIRSAFGSGIVVSRRECLMEYPAARRSLDTVGIDLPEDPGELREWATVMCWTGLVLARRRGLLPEPLDAVLHASGSYARGDFEAVPTTERVEITGAAHIVDAIRRVSREREGSM